MIDPDEDGDALGRGRRLKRPVWFLVEEGDHEVRPTKRARITEQSHALPAEQPLLLRSIATSSTPVRPRNVRDKTKFTNSQRRLCRLRRLREDGLPFNSFSSRALAATAAAKVFIQGVETSSTAEAASATTKVELRLRDMIPEVFDFYGYEKRGPSDPELKARLRSYKMDSEVLKAIYQEYTISCSPDQFLGTCSCCAQRYYGIEIVHVSFNDGILKILQVEGDKLAKLTDNPDLWSPFWFVSKVNGIWHHLLNNFKSDNGYNVCVPCKKSLDAGRVPPICLKTYDFGNLDAFPEFGHMNRALRGLISKYRTMGSLLKMDKLKMHCYHFPHGVAELRKHSRDTMRLVFLGSKEDFENLPTYSHFKETFEVDVEAYETIVQKLRTVNPRYKDFQSEVVRGNIVSEPLGADAIVESNLENIETDNLLNPDTGHTVEEFLVHSDDPEMDGSSLERMAAAFSSLVSTLDGEGSGDPVNRSGRESEPINEFSASNAEVISGAFPHLFPTGEFEETTGTVSQEMIHYLFRFFDGRFQRDPIFIFYLFSQRKRHRMLEISKRIFRNHKQLMKELVSMLNIREGRRKVIDQLNNLSTPEGTKLTRLLSKVLVTASASSGINMVKKSYTRKGYSLTNTFGCPTWFLTFSPDCNNDLLNLRLCLQDPKKELVDPQGSAFRASGMWKDMNLKHVFKSNPGHAAYVHSMLKSNFESILLRCMDSRSSKTTSKVQRGAMSFITGWISMTEEQKREALHQHMICTGFIPPYILDYLLQYPDYREIIIEVLDSIISASILPAHIVDKAAARAVGSRQTPPSSQLLKLDLNNFDASLEETASLVNCYTNSHDHLPKPSTRCIQGIVGKSRCSLGYPKCVCAETTVRRLSRNTDGELVVEDISEIEVDPMILKPHIYNLETDNEESDPFPSLDTNCLVFELKRVYNEELEEALRDYNGTIVPFNALVSAVLKCNTAMLQCCTREAARAAMFYILPYVFKGAGGPMPSRILVTATAAAERLYKYKSKADDTGTEVTSSDRNMINFLQAFLNKFCGSTEWSQVHAASWLLGNDDFTSSCAFEAMNTAAFVDFVQSKTDASYGSSKGDGGGADKLAQTAGAEDEEGTPLIELCQTGSGEVVVIDKCQTHYLHRGGELSFLSAFLYHMVISVEKKKRTTDNEGDTPSGAVDVSESSQAVHPPSDTTVHGCVSRGAPGVKSRDTYSFSSLHPLSATHCQYLRHKFKTVDYGMNPPKYPLFKDGVVVDMDEADRFGKFILSVHSPINCDGTCNYPLDWHGFLQFVRDLRMTADQDGDNAGKVIAIFTLHLIRNISPQGFRGYTDDNAKKVREFEARGVKPWSERQMSDVRVMVTKQYEPRESEESQVDALAVERLTTTLELLMQAAGVGTPHVDINAKSTFITNSKNFLTKFLSHNCQPLTQYKLRPAVLLKRTEFSTVRRIDNHGSGESYVGLLAAFGKTDYSIDPILPQHPVTKRGYGSRERLDFLDPLVIGVLVPNEDQRAELQYYCSILEDCMRAAAVNNGVIPSASPTFNRWLHGGPGTGKSTTIRILSMVMKYLSDFYHYPYNPLKGTASTGCAAALVRLGFSTTHSALHIRCFEDSSNNSDYRKKNYSYTRQYTRLVNLIEVQASFKGTLLLVIDEAGFFKAEVMGEILCRIREIFPGGHVNILWLGDFQQLQVGLPIYEAVIRDIESSRQLPGCGTFRKTPCSLMAAAIEGFLSIKHVELRSSLNMRSRGCPLQKSMVNRTRDTTTLYPITDEMIETLAKQVIKESDYVRFQNAGVVTSCVPVMEAVNPLMAVAHARRTNGRVIKWKAKFSDSCPLRSVNDEVKHYLYTCYENDLYEYFELKGDGEAGGALIKSNVFPEKSVANGVRVGMLTCFWRDDDKHVVDNILATSTELIPEVPRPRYTAFTIDSETARDWPQELKLASGEGLLLLGMETVSMPIRQERKLHYRDPLTKIEKYLVVNLQKFAFVMAYSLNSFKEQGMTETEGLIADMNKSVKGMYSLNLAGFLVMISRTTTFDKFRLFPIHGTTEGMAEDEKHRLAVEALQYLKDLHHNPYYVQWLGGLSDTTAAAGGSVWRYDKCPPRPALKRKAKKLSYKR